MSYINVGYDLKTIQVTQITQPVNCEKENCVYMIECNQDKFKQKYIRETKRNHAKRLSEQRGLTRMFPTKANVIYLNQSGHSLSDARITILEEEKRQVTKATERYLINKLNLILNNHSRFSNYIKL